MKTAQDLKKFLLEKMKMTEIYQPAVIKFLVKNNGKASLREIAKYLASMDEEIIAYYIDRLKAYPKEVLKKHGVAQIEKGSNAFHSIQPLNLQNSEILDIEEICDTKIKDWLGRNTELERTSSGWGKIRHEMICEHHYCALCGLTPDDGIKLDIDHILPRSKGGTDDKENLQVLCHKCNRGKNNHLFKSAQDAKSEHSKKQDNCVFCKLLGKGAIERVDWMEAYLEKQDPKSSSFPCFLLKKLSEQEVLSSQPEMQTEVMQKILQDELTRVRSCAPEYLTPE